MTINLSKGTKTLSTIPLYIYPIAGISTLLAPFSIMMMVLFIFVLMDMVLSIALQLKKEISRYRKERKVEFVNIVVKLDLLFDNVLDKHRYWDSFTKFILYTLFVFAFMIIDALLLKIKPEELLFMRYTLSNAVCIIFAFGELSSSLKHAYGILKLKVFIRMKDIVEEKQEQIIKQVE